MERRKANELATKIILADPTITTVGFQSAFEELIGNKDSFHETLSQNFGIASGMDRGMIIRALKKGIDSK